MRKGRPSFWVRLSEYMVWYAKEKTVVWVRLSGHKIWYAKGKTVLQGEAEQS